jgi:hypothetical protein
VLPFTVSMLRDNVSTRTLTIPTPLAMLLSMANYLFSAVVCLSILCSADRCGPDTRPSKL